MAGERTCPSCGATVGVDDRFCRQCGKPLIEAAQGEPAGKAAGPTEAAIQPGEQLRPAQAEPADQPSDQARTIWEARPSLKRHLSVVYVCLAVLIVLLLRLAIAWPEGFTSWLIWTAPFVLALAGLARSAWKILTESLCLQYRLTADRLFVRRGLLRVTVDQTELIRVDDIRVRQGLIDRLLGLGDVEIISTDATDAQLVLRGIPRPMELAETLRQAVHAIRSKRSLFMERI